MSTLVVSTCDCGFRSKPTTEGYAAYALRKHSCERHQREAASAARGRARHAAIDRTPKDCFHKVARHEHGTHACYVLDRCKCLPCAVANAASRARNVARRHGWQPALAWDDDTIDEPTARPMLEAEPVGDLDEVAVLRIMAGTLRLPSHGRSPERTEAIRRMAARGLSDRQVGGYLGMSRDAVLKVRERNSIPSYVTDYSPSSRIAGYGPALRSPAGRTA